MDALERTIARWVKNSRGLDAKLFINGPAFAAYPTPTILVTSPDCGPSLSTFEINYTEDGDGLFPTLTWTLPPTINASDVVEYVLVVEDADAPLGSTPALHGAVYHIPTNKIEITQSDLERVRGQKGELKGGLQYAQTLTGAVYGAPRPLRGHGPHRADESSRYFYQIVALNAPLGKMRLPAKREELAKDCEGKVVGWGNWIGIAERK